MALEQFGNGEQNSSVRNKINSNFTKLNTIAEAHNPVLTFDKNKYTETAISQSAAINYTLATTGNVDGTVIKHKILSDGVNPIAFSADFNVFNKSDDNIYPSGLHIFYFNYVGGEVDVAIPTYQASGTTTPTNTAPSTTADDYSVDENNTLTVNTANGVLSNDADADSDTLTASLVSDVTNGVLNLASDGSFTYTPNADYFGSDSFTYKSSDGIIDGNIVTVTIAVNEVVTDTTSPTILTATIEDASPSNLVVVFSEVVAIGDLTDLSITGTNAPIIISVTGSGTNTLTFILSEEAINGQALTFVVGATNTIEDAVNNTLAATSKAITNNVSVSTVPAYTPDALTTPFTTAVAVPDDSTVLFTGTPQELTGKEYTYHIDKLIKDLKTATGATDLTTIFSAIYPRFGDSYNMIKYNLLNPQDTNAAKRLVYSGLYLYKPEGVQMDLVNSPNPSNGSYWNPYITMADWNPLGHGVISVIATDIGNAPAGKNNYLFAQQPNTTLDPEASSISLSIGDSKTIVAAVNGTSDSTLTGEATQGVYGVFQVGADATGTESGIWKNGVRRKTLFGGPFGDNAGNASIFGGAYRKYDDSGDAITFSSSKQLHLSEAYIKAPLTEAQIVAVSNSFSDFEGRINRKTWA